jgi:signal transduction histidine kinase/DNA-binding response OmpR family regulator
MSSLRDKLYPTTVQQKILAGFFLAFVAIVLALIITHFSFRKMLDTVDELSAPNEKLTLLNNVFEEITTLDQLQRAEAIRHPNKPYKAFLNQSQTLNGMIDTLLVLPWDTLQHQRLASMKQMLRQRNKIFFSYLRLKARYAKKQNFINQLDTLADIIEQSQVDTSVVTTERKTTTTFTDSLVEQKEEQRTGLAKLFSKKKTILVPETHIKVQEETSIIIDTVAFAKQNKALEEVERIMQELDETQLLQENKLQHRELELIHANSLFISQLLNTLHEVENEELQQMRANSRQAGTLFNDSISRISLLVIVFFLLAAVLVYFIWMDISKSNFFKEQLERSRDEAQELGKIKERFLANMSHEIRTPLQSIIGFAEQLKHTEGNRTAASAIHSSSEHLLHIVNEVLDYSRISSGTFTITNAPFNLLELVDDVEGAMKVQADKKNLKFMVDTDQAEDFTVSGDAFRLRQILYNLLGNAIKFTKEGSVTLTVKTHAEGSRVACTFDVTDTGIGIRTEDLHRIFNQFEQAGNSITTQETNGSGLGLTIARSLTEVQNGTLTVSSEYGIGSTFTVNLSFERAADAVVHPETIWTPSAEPFHGRVLLVDDDIMILRLCELILTRNNIPHKIFQQAEKLLHYPVDSAVTHVLMDIRMPDINGMDLCAMLREKYSDNTHFVALTAHVFQQDQQKLLDAGFDAVLSKPFHEHELLTTLGVSLQAAAPAISSDKSDYDFSLMRKMTMGDDELFQSVMNQFVEETENDLVMLEEHMKQQEAGPIREIVHKLAGRIGQMGITDLGKQLRSIENKIIGGSSPADLATEIILAKTEVDKLIRNVKLVAV